MFQQRIGLIIWLVRRAVFGVGLLFVVSALSFVLMSVTPGNAAQEILGANATPESYARLQSALGLDKPLYDQYWSWLHRALHGDFGTSVITGEHVRAAIDVRLPVTLSLIGCALIVIVVVGVALGTISAVRGGILGRVVDVLSLGGFALPSFWVGAVLITIFAVKLHWFPAVGYVPLARSPEGWLKSLALPVTALALHGAAAIAKQSREAMLDALGSEHIRIGRLNGLPERSLIFRHALKNSGIRIVTVLGIQAIGLLGGSVFVENVFSLPGLGSLIVTASGQHDLPVVQGIALYFTAMVLVLNTVIDLAYGWLNPRVAIR